MHLTLDSLRQLAVTTKDLPGNAVVVLSVPDHYPPRPDNGGRFQARRLVSTMIRVEDDGTAYPVKDRKWLVVVEGRYDRDPKTTPGCPSIGDIKNQE